MNGNTNGITISIMTGLAGARDKYYYLIQSVMAVDKSSFFISYFSSSSSYFPFFI